MALDLGPEEEQGEGGGQGAPSSRSLLEARHARLRSLLGKDARDYVASART